MAAKKTYTAVFGHVGFLPGRIFHSRMEVKLAGLHKANQGGISWGLISKNSKDRRAADAIVLSNGYEDDQDSWDEVVYTGAGGRNGNTGRQIEDQTWKNPGNDALRCSREKAFDVRVIRGSEGDPNYSPTSGYRYDGLYRVVEDWMEEGRLGFLICRFRLRRLPKEAQELTAMERQLQDAIEDVPRRKTSTVERIVRDTAVAQRIKRLYGNICQICNIPLTIDLDGRSYAEGAHVQALGKPQSGPDVDGNVLCLCPNCHIKLDRGAIYLTDDLNVVHRYADGSRPRMTKLTTVEGHEIRERFLRAHRTYWGVLDEQED